MEAGKQKSEQAKYAEFLAWEAERQADVNLMTARLGDLYKTACRAADMKGLTDKVEIRRYALNYMVGVFETLIEIG